MRTAGINPIIAGMMQNTSAKLATRPPTTRSRVTNGSCILPGVDGRSSNARRFRDLIAELTAEAGGNDALSPTERGAIRQAAAVMLQAERMQGAIVRDEPVDNDTLIRLSGEARRLLAGLRKRAPAKPPSPAEYLANRVAERAGKPTESAA
jgi:hypothetical protein